MPGTTLYKRLQREGRLLFDRWWLDPDYRYGQAVFRPARMTPDELTQGCRRARRAFYSVRSILRRGWNWDTRGRSWERLALFAGCLMRN